MSKAHDPHLLNSLLKQYGTMSTLGADASEDDIDQALNLNPDVRYMDKKGYQLVTLNTCKQIADALLPINEEAHHRLLSIAPELGTDGINSPTSPDNVTLFYALTGPDGPVAVILIYRSILEVVAKGGDVTSDAPFITSLCNALSVILIDHPDTCRIIGLQNPTERQALTRTGTIVSLDLVDPTTILAGEARCSELPPDLAARLLTAPFFTLILDVEDLSDVMPMHAPGRLVIPGDKFVSLGKLTIAGEIVIEGPKLVVAYELRHVGRLSAKGSFRLQTASHLTIDHVAVLDAEFFYLPSLRQAKSIQATVLDIAYLPNLSNAENIDIIASKVELPELATVTNLRLEQCGSVHLPRLTSAFFSITLPDTTSIILPFAQHVMKLSAPKAISLVTPGGVVKETDNEELLGKIQEPTIHDLLIRANPDNTVERQRALDWYQERRAFSPNFFERHPTSNPFTGGSTVPA